MVGALYSPHPLSSDFVKRQSRWGEGIETPHTNILVSLEPETFCTEGQNHIYNELGTESHVEHSTLNT